MQPHLSAQQSAALAEVMLERSMQKVRTFWPGKRVLCVAPDHNHPLIRRLGDTYEFETQSQVGTNLGEKMANALGQGINRFSGAAVLGCDVPHLPGALLSECYQSMLDGQNVIGPALDGGFYLLGLCSVDQGIPAQLFKDLVWGESAVFTGLAANARRVRTEFRELSTLRDVDNYRDLEAIAGQDPCFQAFLTRGG